VSPIGHVRSLRWLLGSRGEVLEIAGHVRVLLQVGSCRLGIPVDGCVTFSLYGSGWTRRMKVRIRIGLLVAGALVLALGLLLTQSTLIGIGVIALVVAVLLKPSPAKPPDEGTITPWQAGSGPL